MVENVKKIKLFPYYGGKYYLLNDIIPEIIRIIKNHDIKCVVDVFGGSGQVILSLPLEYKVNRIYNDIDKRLIAVLKILMDNEKREKLFSSLEYSMRSRDIFNEFKNSDWDKLNDDEVALRFLYLVTYSFSAGMESYGTMVNSNRANAGALLNNLKNNFKYIQALTNIENLDFRDLIKKYGGEKTLFYLDPPYLTGGKKYKYIFVKQDFIDLKELLDTTNSKYILNSSGIDFDFMKSVFGDYTYVKEYANYVSNKDTSSRRLEGYWIKED